MLKNVSYLQTTSNLDELPKDNIPEIAIIGKSNVGKSTLINFITNNSKLAKTSSKPGKTKAISLFNFDNKLRIVDLPGYGYAKVSKETKKVFEEVVLNYLSNRKNVDKVIILLDIRRGLSLEDMDYINLLINLGLPFILIGTKLDKAKQSIQYKFRYEIREKLNTEVILISSLTKKGLDGLENIFNFFI